MNSIRHLKHLTAFIVLIFFSDLANAELKTAHIFGDHMVIQRGMKVPVWGTARPGSTIVAEIAGVKYSGIANKAGHWKIFLEGMEPGGPYDLRLSGDGELVLTDVLVGDVWLASGQSNMGWILKNSKDSEREIADANYPKMRLFTVPRRVSRLPVADLNGGAWSHCSPETAANFSAVAYFFGKQLHLDKNVPIGLINCSWGGTPAEAWTGNNMLKSQIDFRSVVEDIENNVGEWDEDIEANDSQECRKNEILDDSFEGLKREVHKFNYNDTNWKLMVVPEWDEEIDGVIWLRKRVDVPKEYKGQKLILDLGQGAEACNGLFQRTGIGHTNAIRIIPCWISLLILCAVARNRVVLRIYHGWGATEYGRTQG